MSDDNGPSSAEIHASGAMGNARSSAGIGNNGGGGPMPIGHQSIDISLGNVDTVFHGESMDGLFSSLNAGGGAFGKTITDDFAAVTGHLGTKEAIGDQGIKLESMGQGERVAPPTIHGDLQLKASSFRGSDGGQRGE